MEKDKFSSMIHQYYQLKLCCQKIMNKMFVQVDLSIKIYHRIEHAVTNALLL